MLPLKALVSFLKNPKYKKNLLNMNLGIAGKVFYEIKQRVNKLEQRSSNICTTCYILLVRRHSKKNKMDIPQANSETFTLTV